METSSRGSEAYRATVSRLRAINDNRARDAELSDLVNAQDEVLHRYQPIFLSIGLEALTKNVMLEFLRFENNCHWTGLHRMGPAITEDIKKLQIILSEVLDEKVPIATRLDRALDDKGARSQHSMKRLGKAVLTGILLIAYPDKYCVWNGTSESALKELGLWPEFKHGTSIGKRYEAINRICCEVARDVDVDLWTLDALWWRAVSQQKELPQPPESKSCNAAYDDDVVRFGLERHLQDFLIDNWEKTPLGKEWALHEEGGDIEGYGYEFKTAVGRIDLLARHRKHDRWLIIELKRGQTSD